MLHFLLLGISVPVHRPHQMNWLDKTTTESQIPSFPGLSSWPLDISPGGPGGDHHLPTPPLLPKEDIHEALQR